MIRTILFDLDGTLTDPKVGITTCVQHALRRMGIEEPSRDRLTSFIGPPLSESFRSRYGMDEQQAAQAIAFYRERFATVGLFENTVYDGVLAMLDRLRDAGLTLAVATSKPTVFSERILDHFALRPYFTVVVGSELDGRRTDKAAVIREVLRQLGTAAADACMVGDRRQDVAGARACGLYPVGVAYGYAEPGELTAAGAAQIVDSVPELETLLLHLTAASVNCWKNALDA